MINILAWGFMYTYIFMSQKRIRQKNISLLPKKCFTFVTWYILALLCCNKLTQACLYPNNTVNHLEIFQKDSHLIPDIKSSSCSWHQKGPNGSKIFPISWKRVNISKQGEEKKKSHICGSDSYNSPDFSRKAPQWEDRGMLMCVLERSTVSDKHLLT